MLLKEGEIIRDSYEVERLLGEGAFAEVYRVKHKFLGRQAMKVFKTAGASPEEIEQMLGEAIILSKIGHPNIIRVFDASVVKTSVGQCGFFTMEYVAGGNLENFWRSHGSSFVHVSDTVEIIRQVCRGLSVAHAENPPIIHRDIKPQNILIGYDAVGLRVRVSDFGLAKKVNPLTLLASAQGTLAFKPPEFLYDIDSCAGDVWGIGATFYLLLTDRLPFPLLDKKDFVDEKCWASPLIPASYFNAQVDTKLDKILFRALALKSADRYRDSKDMLEDLMKWEPLQVKNSAQAKGSPDESKFVLGPISVSQEKTVEKMLFKALELSRNSNRLSEAADLLEETLNKDPSLREKYEYHLKLWRRGIAI
jgi:serine/threonine-protein kinase